MREELEAEIRGAELISDISTRLLSKASLAELLDELLNAAIELTGASFGTLQLADGRVYKLMAHRGFQDEFLTFFGEVRESSESVCAATLASGRRMIVEDVESDPGLDGTEAREVLLRAGVRAVQSTPLVGASGEIYGVFSTHFRQPCLPTERGLRFVDLLAVRTSQIIEAHLRTESQRTAEGVRASGQLANSLAHELNNPVQALTNVVELLCGDPLVMGRAAPLLGAASEQLGRVSGTLKRMLVAKDTPQPSSCVASSLVQLVQAQRERIRRPDQDRATAPSL